MKYFYIETEHEIEKKHLVDTLVAAGIIVRKCGEGKQFIEKYLAADRLKRSRDEKTGRKMKDNLSYFFE